MNKTELKTFAIQALLSFSFIIALSLIFLRSLGWTKFNIIVLIPTTILGFTLAWIIAYVYLNKQSVYPKISKSSTRPAIATGLAAGVLFLIISPIISIQFYVSGIVMISSVLFIKYMEERYASFNKKLKELPSTTVKKKQIQRTGFTTTMIIMVPLTIDLQLSHFKVDIFTHIMTAAGYALILIGLMYYALRKNS